jgi:hypothetical protein
VRDDEEAQRSPDIFRMRRQHIHVAGLLIRYWTATLETEAELDCRIMTDQHGLKYWHICQTMNAFPLTLKDLVTPNIGTYHVRLWTPSPSTLKDLVTPNIGTYVRLWTPSPSTLKDLVTPNIGTYVRLWTPSPLRLLKDLVTPNIGTVTYARLDAFPLHLKT